MELHVESSLTKAPLKGRLWTGRSKQCLEGEEHEGSTRSESVGLRSFAVEICYGESSAFYFS
jgi:hypothetical protein